MVKRVNTGIFTYVKNTRRKRPGRHVKKPNKKKKFKKYIGQGR